VNFSFRFPAEIHLLPLWSPARRFDPDKRSFLFSFGSHEPPSICVFSLFTVFPPFGFFAPVENRDRQKKPPSVKLFFLEGFISLIVTNSVVPFSSLDQRCERLEPGNSVSHEYPLPPPYTPFFFFSLNSSLPEHGPGNICEACLYGGFALFSRNSFGGGMRVLSRKSAPFRRAISLLPFFDYCSLSTLFFFSFLICRVQSYVPSSFRAVNKALSWREIPLFFKCPSTLPYRGVLPVFLVFAVDCISP